MMEFSNLDHQHQQDLHGGSSSLPSPPFPLVGGIYECNPNIMLNGGVFIPNVNGVLPFSRDFKLNNEIPPSHINTHMIQDLGFQWDRPADYMNHPGNQENSSPTEDFHLLSTSCIKSEKQGLQELDERLFLRALCQTNGLQPQPRDLLHDAQSFAGFGGRGTYSMVLPTTDVTRLDIPSPSSQSFSLGMDLQALDILASAKYGQSFSGSSFSSMSMLCDETPFRHHMQEPAQEALNNHIKISSLINGVNEAKRTNSCLEPKESQLVLKKPRFETRSSCAPFKVRKEKLGDRIAALQQLVAPFGKTDTASVLMEAIGYIKFLQDQVETLSVPYLRSANNKKMWVAQEASSEDGDEFKPDLRSRGLCLVPLSCTSYVTNENGGVWSPPNYRGSD